MKYTDETESRRAHASTSTTTRQVSNTALDVKPATAWEVTGLAAGLVGTGVGDIGVT